MALKSKHRTADGTTMLIAEMACDHLLNWIDYCIRQAEGVAMDFLRSVKEAQVESTPINKAFDRMYGIERKTPEVSAAAYADTVERLVTILEPYFTEVFIRNFTDAQNQRIGTLRARFQACVGRSYTLNSRSAPKLIEGWTQLPDFDWADSDDDGGFSIHDFGDN
jgi:hypothetical protein